MGLSLSGRVFIDSDKFHVIAHGLPEALVILLLIPVGDWQHIGHRTLNAYGLLSRL